MRIASVTLSNFRCFGPSPTTVLLERLSCLIGANGSGKSAVLQSLVKLFGVIPSDRGLRASDFHVPKGQQFDDVAQRSLFIEAKIVFPELAENGEAHGVPECFNQMIIESPGDERHHRGDTTGSDLKFTVYEVSVFQSFSIWQIVANLLSWRPANSCVDTPPLHILSSHSVHPPPPVASRLIDTIVQSQPA